MKQLPIHKTLKSNLEIVALIGDRIYEDIAPEGTISPYIVWQDLKGTPSNCLEGDAQIDHVMFQVMVYSPYSATAMDIRTLVANVLESKCYINSRIGHYETDTKLFARGFDANWWLDR